MNKCDICDKEEVKNFQKYCTVSWRRNWENLFGRRMKELPLKGEIYLCEECNKAYEDDYRGKEEEAQRKKDYRRIFGTEQPTVEQLRNDYLKRDLGYNNDSEKKFTSLIAQGKSILQDPLLDSEDAIISAVHLIGLSGLLKKEVNISDKELEKEIKSDPYFCQQLTKFHNSPPNSAAGKVWQIFIKNGILLDRYYKCLENNEKKKQQQSEFTKQRIINNIQDWGIKFYRKEGKSTIDQVINQKNKFDYIEKREVEEKDWQEIIKLLNGKELQQKDCRWPTAEEYKNWVLEINPETRQKWDLPLTEQQRKVIQDPVLTSSRTRPFHPPKKEDLENPHYSVPDITVDTISKVLECFSYLQKAQEQIEECLAKNSFWGAPAEYYTFQGLEKIQKAPASTDLGKVCQALENNGFLLANEINKLNKKIKSKSGELKKKILANLTDCGVDAEQLASTFANFNDRYASINKVFLTEKDCQEVKRAIIENIKSNKNEWKIESRWIPISPGGYVKFIVHKPSGKYHYAEGFTNQEFQEIKKCLSSNSLILVIVLGVIMLSVSIFLFWWYWKKKKNRSYP